MRVGESFPETRMAASSKNMHRDKSLATEVALIKREPMKFKEIKVGHLEEFGWKKGKG